MLVADQLQESEAEANLMEQDDDSLRISTAKLESLASGESHTPPAFTPTRPGRDTSVGSTPQNGTRGNHLSTPSRSDHRTVTSDGRGIAVPDGAAALRTPDRSGPAGPHHRLIKSEQQYKAGSASSTRMHGAGTPAARQAAAAPSPASASASGGYRRSGAGGAGAHSVSHIPFGLLEDQSSLLNPDGTYELSRPIVPPSPLPASVVSTAPPNGHTAQIPASASAMVADSEHALDRNELSTQATAVPHIDADDVTSTARSELVRRLLADFNDLDVTDLDLDLELALNGGPIGGAAHSDHEPV